MISNHLFSFSLPVPTDEPNSSTCTFPNNKIISLTMVFRSSPLFPPFPSPHGSAISPFLPGFPRCYPSHRIRRLPRFFFLPFFPRLGFRSLFPFFPVFPRFPPGFPRFPPFSPVFPRFSPFFPVFPRFPPFCNRRQQPFLPATTGNGNTATEQPRGRGTSREGGIGSIIENRRKVLIQ